MNEEADTWDDRVQGDMEAYLGYLISRNAKNERTLWSIGLHEEEEERRTRRRVAKHAEAIRRCRWPNRSKERLLLPLKPALKIELERMASRYWLFELLMLLLLQLNG